MGRLCNKENPDVEGQPNSTKRFNRRSKSQGEKKGLDKKQTKAEAVRSV